MEKSITRIHCVARRGQHEARESPLHSLIKYSGTEFVEGQVRDLYDAINEEIFKAGREYMIGSQTPLLASDLPLGAVMPLAPGQGFNLNSHYVNKGNGVITEKCLSTFAS
jgi:hypothetical protein